MAFEIFVDIWTSISQLDIIIRIGLSCVMLILLVALSLWQRINMETMFLWSFFRGFIQIILMGSILTLIFDISKAWLLYIVLVLMCMFAAFTISRRYRYPKMFLIELLAITSSSILILTIVMFSGQIPGFIGIIPYPEDYVFTWSNILPVKGEYVIPMGSMVISNTMVITSIVLERSKSDILKSKGTVEAALALGDSTKNAVRVILRDSYKAGLMPTTTRVAVLGIVTIPGLMSGMIIGGVNPIEAAVYQVVIFLMILSSSFPASIIASSLFTRQFFTSEQQFNIKFLNQLEKIENEKKNNAKKKSDFREKIRKKFKRSKA